MANTRQVQVVTAPTQAYAEAERKRVLADALQQRAMKPRDMSYMQGADPYLSGFTQIAEALLARKQGKKATAAEVGADAQMRDTNRAAIEKLAGAYQFEGLDDMPATQIAGGSLPGSQIEAGLAGMDPRDANQVVAKALMEKALPPRQDPKVVPYGSMLVDQSGNTLASNDRLPNTANNSGDMQWLTKFMEANPGASFEVAAKAHADYKRSMQPDRPPDPVTLATIATPDDPTKGRVVDGRTGRVIGDAVTAPPKAADNAKAQGRLAALDATKIALARVQSASDTLGGGGGFIEGRLPAMGEVTQDYDGAVAQLLAAIQSALRVPGIGSQSNMELQALMGALPLRKQEKTVRDNQITGIAQRLEAIISREAAAGDEPAPGAPAAPSAVDAALSPAEQAELETLRQRLRKPQ